MDPVTITNLSVAGAVLLVSLLQSWVIMRKQPTPTPAPATPAPVAPSSSASPHTATLMDILVTAMHSQAGQLAESMIANAIATKTGVNPALLSGILHSAAVPPQVPAPAGGPAAIFPLPPMQVHAAVRPAA
jgi:hypothetical protein